MRSFMIAIIATVFGAITLPAMAADLGASVKDVTVQTVEKQSWSGIWLGAVGGYAVSNTDLDFAHTYDETTYTSNFSGIGGEGFFGEFQGGLDYQIPASRIVVGIIGAINLPALETEASADGEKISVKAGTNYLVGGRLGLLLNEHAMLYGAGGYRWAEFELNGFNSETNGDYDVEGVWGEGGIETRLAANTYGKIFGRYTEYDTQHATISNRDDLKIEPGVLEVGAGITFKFGTPNVGF